MSIAELFCEWCHEAFEADELLLTDIGCLCPRCIEAIRSHGEEVTVL